MAKDPGKLIQQVLDVSPAPLIQVDAEGVIVRANRACTALLGYSPQELVGQPVGVLLPEEQRAAQIEDFLDEGAHLRDVLAISLAFDARRDIHAPGRDLTHVRPIHPDAFEFLVKAIGFRTSERRFLSPYGPDEQIPRVGSTRNDRRQA